MNLKKGSLENNMELILEKWEEILRTVKEEHDLTDISFNTWLKPLSVYSIEGSKLYILVPSEQMGLNYITKKYTLPIKVAIAEITGIDYEIEFILQEQTKNIRSFKSKNPEFVPDTEKSNLNPNYTFETFVVGKNNKFAHAASLAVSESPGEVYNPLYIYGGPGLGKTHLMQSIGHFILQQKPEKKVIYVTSEEFTNEVIDSIRNGNASAMTKLRDKYRTVDVLMIDDVQFIIGKESTQEEFFHTFNTLHSAGKQIILSSDKPPKDMETLEERFRSRFEWGLIADIQPPDYETRMAILKKNAENYNKEIDDEVFKYIAENIKSNIRELEGAFNKIIAFSKLYKVDINLAYTEEALKDVIYPNKPKEITPSLIIEVVAEHFGVSPEDITSKKRNSEFVQPRQVVMYLCRELIDTSLNNIGKLLGKKDHTTVIHGVNKIKEEMTTNEELKNKVDIIRKKIVP